MSRLPHHREDLQAAFGAAVAAADPGAALLRVCARRDNTLLVVGEELDLTQFEHVWLVGAGKAVVPLASAAIEILGDVVSGVSLTTRHGHAEGAPFDIWEAGHPVPDAGSLAGAADALRIARGVGPHDLFICLLTGGASSLWAAPVPGVSLSDLRVLTAQLLRSGASIQEMNSVRKHLSVIGGGQLARAAAPATMFTFALSDVVGNRPDTIGSGPTVPDPTTYEEALTVLSSRGVSAPSSVLAHLQKGAAGEVAETPKPGSLGGTFHIVASVQDAVAAASAELRHRGYEVQVLTAAGEGEAAEIGRQLAARARARSAAGATRLALVWGGESTVKVSGAGRGGRNQEMALAAGVALEGAHHITIGCFATDGTDGPTEAAGGFADGSSVELARNAGFDAADVLGRNDSYTLLEAIGDLIVTGPTGTNVNDLAITLID